MIEQTMFVRREQYNVLKEFVEQIATTGSPRQAELARQALFTADKMEYRFPPDIPDPYVLHET